MLKGRGIKFLTSGTIRSINWGWCCVALLEERDVLFCIERESIVNLPDAGRLEIAVPREPEHCLQEAEGHGDLDRTPTKLTHHEPDFAFTADSGAYLRIEPGNIHVLLRNIENSSA